MTECNPETHSAVSNEPNEKENRRVADIPSPDSRVCRRLRVLLSALSCNQDVGSEALVGYRYAEALAARHDVTLLSAEPVQPPPGIQRCHRLRVGKCAFNDVAAHSLLRFELQQIPRALWLTRTSRFDVVHRVT